MKKNYYLLVFISFILVFQCKKDTVESRKAQFSKVTQENQLIYVWSLNTILNKENKMSDFIFGGEKKQAKYKEEYRNFLREWWGINSKTELLNSINQLSNAKMHAPKYMEEFGPLLDFSPEEIQKNYKEYPEYVATDSVLWNHRKLLKEKGFQAWDLIRAAGLIGWGYQADYLSKDESYELALPLGRTVQKNFSNYKELYEDYLLGYLIWAESYDEYLKRSNIINTEYKDPTAACNVIPFDYSMKIQ